MNQDAVMAPMGDRAQAHLKTLARTAAVTRQDLISSRRGSIAAAKASKDGVPS
jgi:hypothetical protein